MRPKCGLTDCNLPHYAKGYCQAHYNRMWFTGKVTATKVGPPIFKRTRGLCSLEGCRNKHYAKKLCQVHYLKARLGSMAGEDDPKCTFPGCKLMHAAKGYCQPHYMAFHNGAFAKMVNSNG
jgi:hypothetical protein